MRDVKVAFNGENVPFKNVFITEIKKLGDNDFAKYVDPTEVTATVTSVRSGVVFLDSDGILRYGAGIQTEASGGGGISYEEENGVPKDLALISDFDSENTPENVGKVYRFIGNESAGFASLQNALYVLED